jgi:hypothetical protein
MLLAFCIPLYADDNPVVVHLSIPPSATATAMGHAFVASIGDPSIVYYNPGALGIYDRFGFTFMNQGFPPGIARVIEEGLLTFTGKVLYRNEAISPEPTWLPLTEGMRSVCSAALLPHGTHGTFGVNLSYFTCGQTDVYNFEGQYLGSYELYDYAIGLSYGRKFSRRHGIGITAKYIYSTRITEWSPQELPELNGGLTVAFDAGVLSRIYGFGFGASITNLGPRIKYAYDTISTGYRLPTRYRWGISFEPVVMLDSLLSLSKYRINDMPVTDLFNIRFCYDQSYDPEETAAEQRWECSGWELTFLKHFSYRFGSFSIWGETSGVGLKLHNIELDVAKYYGDSYHVQISLFSHRPPEHIKENQKLHRAFIITTAALAPGGAQFYKGEGLKGSAFLAPALYLANAYYTTDNRTTKTLSLIGIVALYIGAAAEALLTD